jgi:hypothetical protein
MGKSPGVPLLPILVNGTLLPVYLFIVLYAHRYYIKLENKIHNYLIIKLFAAEY